MLLFKEAKHYSKRSKSLQIVNYFRKNQARTSDSMACQGLCMYGYTPFWKKKSKYASDAADSVNQAKETTNAFVVDADSASMVE